MAHDGVATPEGEFEGDSCDCCSSKRRASCSASLPYSCPPRGPISLDVSNFGIRDAVEEAQRRRAAEDGEMRNDPRAAVLLRFETISSGVSPSQPPRAGVPLSHSPPEQGRLSLTAPKNSGASPSIPPRAAAPPPCRPPEQGRLALTTPQSRGASPSQPRRVGAPLT
ncbi:unnamed protein product [Closterium sp. NIES-64]|nr:unnamed protein product [Closterium sp. NIES-64]